MYEAMFVWHLYLQKVGWYLIPLSKLNEAKRRSYVELKVSNVARLVLCYSYTCPACPITLFILSGMFLEVLRRVSSTWCIVIIAYC